VRRKLERSWKKRGLAAATEMSQQLVAAGGRGGDSTSRGDLWQISA